MIPLSTYKSFWDYIASVITTIDMVFIVHEESDLASVIRDIESGTVILFAVIPSSDIEATNFDDYEEIDSCFVFVVKKCERGDLTHVEFIADMQVTQEIIRNVKLKMIELAANTDQCLASGSFTHLMHRLFLNGMHTDPEYNMLGCNGWGMSFKLKTKGL